MNPHDMSVENIDWFVRIVDDPRLQVSIDTCRVQLREYEEFRANEELTPEDRAAIALALIRVKRMRYQLEPGYADDAFAKATRLIAQVSADKHAASLTLKKNLLSEELRLYQTGDSTGAADRLTALLTSEAREDDLFYGLVASAMCTAHTLSGDIRAAEEWSHDCISIWRRRGNRLLHAYALNSHGVIKKRLCLYREAERWQEQSLRMMRALGAEEAQALIYNNLGITKMKLGAWNGADECFQKATELLKENGHLKGYAARFGRHAEINRFHLLITRRCFDEAERMVEPLTAWTESDAPRTHAVLCQEFIGELALERSDLNNAHEHLRRAKSVAAEIGPNSDLMTEITRREAEVHLKQGSIDAAIGAARACIRLCRRIGDKHEMGAAIRILAQALALRGDERRATAAFKASIRVLRDIGECYELMRSSIAFAEHCIDTQKSELDIYLMEARQLASQLEIDYYLARVNLLFTKHAIESEDYMVARQYLSGIDEICGRLERRDRCDIVHQVRVLRRALERALLQSTMKSAARIQAIGKIYEDARFPIDELGPEMITDVARRVGASRLFLAKRRSRGYTVPLRYNIGAQEAKSLLMRRRERSIRRLFDSRSPVTCSLPNGQHFVGVTGNGYRGYALCAVGDRGRDWAPRDLEMLFASVEALERVADARDARSAPGEGSFDGERVVTHPGGAFERVLTIDPVMTNLIHLVERASESTVPVLLEGETGVGKELFARAVHENSSRRSRQFVALNAGGMPLSLLESQLFGHVKGAFTDAISDRAGLIEEARGGTLLLDEIGEMSEELQVKLLRLLENGEFRRLGDNRARTADVRVISATNKNLEQRMKDGLFREDLYYRLATVRFRIPPLRDRKGDVEFLVRHFLSKGMAAIGKRPRPVNVDVKALEALERYPWPGNVRELRNEVLRCLSLIGDGSLIRFGMLSDRLKDYFAKNRDKGMLTERVERYERRLILEALDANDWNRNRTADKIGIPRTTLLFKMKRFNIVS